MKSHFSTFIIMALLFGGVCGDILSLVTILVTTIYLLMRYRYTYWERKGIKSLPPAFPFGNFGAVFTLRASMGTLAKELYDKTIDKLIGIYMVHRPALLVKDPEIIKSILVRDFWHFHGRGTYVDEKREPLSAHLFNLSGPKWRKMRVKMSPIFTSGKLKAMFQTNITCADELAKYLTKNCTENSEQLNMKDFTERYTTDIIGSVAFGIDVNSIENPRAPFRMIGQKIFETSMRNSINFAVMFLVPKLVNVLKMRNINPEVDVFMRSVVKQTIEHREQYNVNRSDFMQLMIQLRNSGQVKEDGDWSITSDGLKQLTIEEVAAQCLVYFAAGFETSSTTMSFCLHELCINPKIQDNVQRDIDDALSKHNGQITYDSLQDMKYLEKTIMETLRKYPPLPVLNRESNEDFTIPELNMTVEKGTPILIPLMGLHRDPKFYPDPMRFDPERFSDENKKTRIPFTFMPFGEGPKACIGMRQGIMQAKVGLATLLSRFTFERCSKTCDVLTFNPRAPLLNANEGIWMTFKYRKENSA